jgi:hypothetical protein
MVIEQTLVLVDLKSLQAVITSLEKDGLIIKKDIEALQKWNEELKKEKDEATRRWWSFGPNITAALLAGIITLVGVAINYWLNHLK